MAKNLAITEQTRNQALIALKMHRKDVEVWAKAGGPHDWYFAGELVKIDAAIAELEASYYA